MNHLSEDQLTDYFYADSGNRLVVEDHLQACELCRQEWESLRATLNAIRQSPTPARASSYGSQVWHRIAGRLDLQDKPKESFRFDWFDFRRLTAFGTLAAVIVAAFLLGRYLRAPGSQHIASDSTEIRQRVLLVALSDHLDRAQMVLMELENSDGTNNSEPHGKSGADVNVLQEQEWARELVVSNRLYRQSALQSGDAKLASILSALEPLLIEIAHSPDKMTPVELQQIQGRIKDSGILFKVRVVGSDVRGREKSLLPVNADGKT